MTDESNQRQAIQGGIAGHDASGAQSAPDAQPQKPDIAVSSEQDALKGSMAQSCRQNAENNDNSFELIDTRKLADKRGQKLKAK